MGNQLLTANVLRQILKETREEYADPPEVHFKRHHIGPDSSQYVGPDDWLQVNVYTLQETTGLTLAMRYLDPEGRVHYASQSLDGIPTSTLTRRMFRLTEGWLLGVCVSALGGGLDDAVCWVSFGLQQSGNLGTPMHTLLAQEFVSNLVSVEWPPVYTRGPAPGGMPAGVNNGDLAIFDGTRWVTFAGNTSGDKHLQEDATGAASWAAPPAQMLQVAQGIITSAQLLDLAVTPVTVVPAPGSGRIIHPIHYQWIYHAGTVPYTVMVAGDLTWLAHGSPNIYDSGPAQGMIDQAFDTIYQGTFYLIAGLTGVPFPASASEDAGLDIGASPALSITDGDGTLEYIVVYSITTLTP